MALLGKGDILYAPAGTIPVVQLIGEQLLGTFSAIPWINDDLYKGGQEAAEICANAYIKYCKKVMVSPLDVIGPALSKLQKGYAA